MDKESRSLEASKVFTPTAPIDERSLFAGRHTQIRQIVDVVNQKGQHAVLFGERGVGKTSLANILKDILISSYNNIISPRINCYADDTFDSVIEKAFGEITLMSQRRKIGFSDKTDLNKFNARDLIVGKIDPESIRKALVLLSDIFKPIIIFDEFDRLKPNVQNVFADLIKALSDHAVGATIIIVGVADSIDQLISAHQSVERALMQIRMPRMSEDEVQEIFTKGYKHLGLSANDDAMLTATRLAQGLPHYAHLIGLHSSRIAIEKDVNTIDLGTIRESISLALGGAQQSIQSIWHKATMSPRKDNLFATVLLSCALAKTDELGYFAAQDVRGPLNIITNKKYEIPNYSQHLKEFTEEKRGPVLKKIGTKRRYRFRFINPLMQPFVIMRGYNEGKVEFK